MFGGAQAEMLITNNLFSPLTNFPIFLIEYSGHIQNQLYATKTDSLCMKPWIFL